eukprot:scaffold12978_cov107-Isochrysis_galbana.AAC.2
MLPCACWRGRFGDAWMSMTVSFGAEAEGAARAERGGEIMGKGSDSRRVFRPGCPAESPLASSPQRQLSWRLAPGERHARRHASSASLPS